MDWHKSAGGYISDCGKYQIVPIHRGDNGNLVYRALHYLTNDTFMCIGIRSDAEEAKSLCDNYVSQ